MHKLTCLPFCLVVLPLAAAASGEVIYEKHCAQCHSGGDANIPQIGDTAQWKFRSGDGPKSLLYSVKQGHNVMPPHGGALKDEEMAAAIDYIVTKSGGWTRK